VAHNEADAKLANLERIDGIITDDLLVDKL
jgi:hypothetical protein